MAGKSVPVLTRTCAVAQGVFQTQKMATTASSTRASITTTWMTIKSLTTSKKSPGAPGSRHQNDFPQVMNPKIQADTVWTNQRVFTGERHPHYNDGSVYRNDQKLLPKSVERYYYREYVIPTEGVNHAGPQRLLKGKQGENYYTPDHYETSYRLEGL